MSVFSRRSFLQSLSSAVVSGALSPVFGEQEKPIRKKNGMLYRRLGRTNLWISEIGTGGSPPPPPTVFAYASRMGLNWFDTSSSYQGGKSEKTYAQYLKKVKRGDYVVCTKMHANTSTRSSKIIREVEGSLKRLDTETIDILHLHGLKDEVQLSNPAIVDACEKLKKDGKIRFTGVSIHKKTAQLMTKVIEMNYHDVVLVAFNVYQDVNKKHEDILLQSGLKAILRDAAQKDIGILAMKVQAGGNRQKLDQYLSGGITAAQAKIMWALSHTFVAGIATEMKNLSEAKDDISAIGKRLSRIQEKEILKYCECDSAETCRMCGICESRCPKNIQTTDIQRFLRYRARYDSSKDEIAAKGYAALSYQKTFAACDGCKTCEKACPWGIHIVDNLERSHRLLRLA